MELVSLEGSERTRRAANFHSAEWSDRGARLAGLVGRSLTSGFAGTLFREYGDAAEERLLLDGLLSLAPAVIQVIAALADDFPLGRGSSDEDGGDRSFVPLGGHENSCYVWRAGSALHQIRTR